MIEFKLDTQFPFTTLIDKLCLAVGETYDTREENAEAFLSMITSLMEMANHLNSKVERPYTPTELNKQLEKEKLPFMVMVKQAAEGNGYTTTPGTEYDIFEIRQSYDYCDNMAIAGDHLERYMRGIAGKSIMATQIATNLQAITYLLNAVYGQFFLSSPNWTYEVDELNLIFSHRCIPFYFKKNQQALFGGMSIPTYTAMEVKW